ncbi:hypothetical protein E2C01_003093 [Portunus trituberculatus]|uniref:Uncharacterized protein n=1 Tax=Portunus trituberculatus TaxID=210409 RepID=A0A5B7CLG1_PORTR|nr:hypothetical protein [Portunus trituberculatus]
MQSDKSLTPRISHPRLHPTPTTVVRWSESVYVGRDVLSGTPRLTRNSRRRMALQLLEPLCPSPITDTLLFMRAKGNVWLSRQRLQQLQQIKQ